MVDDNETVEAHPIGNMSCGGERRQEFRRVNGRRVGEIRMGFERDGEGIAIKFRDRNDKMLEKTGERSTAQLKTFLIPDDEELVGFHGA